MTTSKLSGFAILSTEDGDLGVFATATAAIRARTEAKAIGKTVYVRDPVTDEVLWTEQPK